MGHNNMKQNFKLTTRCNKYFSSAHRKIMSFYCIKEKFDYTSVGEYSSQTTKDADSGFCSRMEENISTTKILVNIKFVTIFKPIRELPMQSK